MSDTLHLKNRNGAWYFSRRLPTKKYHVVSLKTKSLREAQKKRNAIDARWEELIWEVDRGKDIMDLRKKYVDEVSYEGREFLADQAQDRAESTMHELGIYKLVHETTDLAHLTDSEREPLDTYKIETGKLSPFKIVVPYWLKTIPNERTRADYRKALERLATVFSCAEEVDYQKAASYLKGASERFGLAKATIQKDQTAFIHLWKELNLEFSVWMHHSIPKTPARSIDRDIWENTEVLALLEKARGDNRKPWLYHVINIAAHTGARAEAISKCRYLPHEGRVWFPRMKYEKLDRRIPVHPMIKESLSYWEKNRRATSTISTAFTDLKKTLGHTGNVKVFHSFRNTFIQQLSFNNVSEGIASAAVGHKITTMTYGRYGGGQALITSLEEAILLVDYNKPNWDRVFTSTAPD